MNLIDENINIEKMYDYQLNDLDSNNYQEYLKLLNLYFSKNHKKDKFNKKKVDGKYILIDKANPSKEIIITCAEFVNIHSLYIQLKNYSNNLLNKISDIIESKNNITEENRKEFDILKKKYMICKEQLKDIHNIDSNFYIEIEKLLTEKIEKTTKLAEFYQKRILAYSNINEMITEKLKNELIKKFKDNKKNIPSINEINKIAKQNSVPSKEIENWFNWIETMYFYLLINNELIKINNEIKDKEQNFDLNTKYMIIKKPIIEKK